jgi:hypothetical protein
MSRLLLPLRRLRWQLTLSYILITLVAALTLEIATTTAGVVAPPKRSTATPAQILVNAMLFTEAPQRPPTWRRTHQAGTGSQFGQTSGRMGSLSASWASGPAPPGRQDRPRRSRMAATAPATLPSQS